MILCICKLTFHIVFEDYNDIKYFFPSRAIYIAIHILIHYFYLKLVFDCIEHYIEMDTFSIIRVGKQSFHRMLMKRVILYILIFTLFSIFIDFLLYQKISVLGLIITLCVEIILGICVVIMYKKLNTNIFVVTLILGIFIQGLLGFLIHYYDLSQILVLLFV